MPAVVIGVKIFGRKIAPFYKRIWRRWAAVTSVLTDSIPCIRVIKSFAGEKRAVRRFEKYNEEWLKVDVKSARITSVYPYIVGFVVTCGSLLIWSVGGGWVIDDSNKPTVNTQEFKDAMNFYLKLIATGEAQVKDDLIASVDTGAGTMGIGWRPSASSTSLTPSRSSRPRTG